MNRRINHALAIRSTRTPRRVTQVDPGATTVSAVRSMLIASDSRSRAKCATRCTACSAAARPGASKKSIATTSSSRRRSRTTTPSTPPRADGASDVSRSSSARASSATDA